MEDVVIHFEGVVAQMLYGMAYLGDVITQIGCGIHGLARSGDTETYLRWEVAHL